MDVTAVVMRIDHPETLPGTFTKWEIVDITRYNPNANHHAHPNFTTVHIRDCPEPFEDLQVFLGQPDWETVTVKGEAQDVLKAMRYRLIDQNTLTPEQISDFDAQKVLDVVWADLTGSPDMDIKAGGKMRERAQDEVSWDNRR